VKADLHTNGEDYLELRPLLQVDAPGSEIAQNFCFHRLDLRPSIGTLYGNFHKDCVQRKIRRAERETLIYEEGRSETLLSHFYELMVETRRRQLLPPQPITWFRNLVACMGDSLKIRLAYKGKQRVASILTLQHKDTLVYKYGCSSKASSNLGGMHLLFWKAIQEAKSNDLETFDLGRSDLDNAGLIDFKDRWGAQRSTLTYHRYRVRPSRKASAAGWKVQLAKYVFARLPASMLVSAGRLLYRHIA
jgi:lipid II:glycine glycyltransferase (peptidoglycan interpeptide bridge formation enzyme)